MVYDVDRVDLPGGSAMPGTVRAYVDDRERSALEAAGFAVTPIPNESKRAHAKAAADWARLEAAGQGDQPPREGNRVWPSYTQLQADLQSVASAHPEIVQDSSPSGTASRGGRSGS